MNRLFEEAVVEKSFRESDAVRTLVFNKSISAVPGQFVMVWVPGKGEKPFAVASASPFSITVASRGEVSSLIAAKGEGEKLYYRGPFGNGFKLVRGRLVCVAGGYGAAPLRFLASEAVKNRAEVKFLMGAKTKRMLLLPPKCGAEVCTDDGSAGERCLVTELLRKELERKADCVYACGPEKMLFEVARVCADKKTECQLSLERIMKCGVGVCGSCAVDGKMACRDGPVFSGEEALSFKEFGKSERDETGRLVEK